MRLNNPSVLKHKETWDRVFYTIVLSLSQQQGMLTVKKYIYILHHFRVSGEICLYLNSQSIKLQIVSYNYVFPIAFNLKEGEISFYKEDKVE